MASRPLNAFGALAVLRARMSPVTHVEPLMRYEAMLTPESAAGAVEAVVGWVQAESGLRLPEAAGQGLEFELFAGGRNVIASAASASGEASWALRCDLPAKRVAGRVFTVDVVVERSATRNRLVTRLVVTSPEDIRTIYPISPAFATGLLPCEPIWLTSEAEVSALVEEIMAPGRRLTLLVASETAGASSPLVDVGDLARRTVGIAQTVVVPAALTGGLGAELGTHTTHSGAVRAYLPGYSVRDRHQMIHPERLASEQQRAAAIKRLCGIAAAASLQQFPDSLPSFAGTRRKAIELGRRAAGATVEAQLRAAEQSIEAMKRHLGEAVSMQDFLVAEHRAAELRAENAEAAAAAARARNLALEMRLRAGTPRAPVEPSLPPAWTEFAAWCDSEFGGRVLLTPRARRELKSALYADVGLAARAVQWLATTYRELRRGGGGDTRGPLFEGLHNEPAGADAVPVSFGRERQWADWHVTTGGNTTDPVRCLRIYYFWDDETEQVVIGWMPSHRPNDIV